MGVYDSRSNFNYLHMRRLEATIPTRKNSVPRARGSYTRTSISEK